MGENDARHREARGPTRRRLCCTPFQNFSQRERDVEECHRRVGRVGPEHRSSRRGRGEQRRPLRRRVGNVGACPPPLFSVAARCLSRALTLYSATMAARAFYPRAILVEPNLCGCFGSNLYCTFSLLGQKGEGVLCSLASPAGPYGSRVRPECVTCIQRTRCGLYLASNAPHPRDAMRGETLAATRV